MSNLKKIQKPKINANLDIISTLDELLQLIEDDEKIYDKLIENMDISNLFAISCPWRTVKSLFTQIVKST